MNLIPEFSPLHEYRIDGKCSAANCPVCNPSMVNARHACIPEVSDADGPEPLCGEAMAELDVLALSPDAGKPVSCSRCRFVLDHAWEFLTPWEEGRIVTLLELECRHSDICCEDCIEGHFYYFLDYLRKVAKSEDTAA